MLDVVTLRVAFALLAICVFVLFYAVTYRSTRSPYSGWWCLSLASFVVSASLFILNGTPAQVASTPLGNAAAVLGAGFVWAAARSLRTTAPRARHLVAVPLLVLVVTVFDDPANDVWAGGAVYLLGMAALIGASAAELAVLLRHQRAALAGRPQYRFAVVALALASGGMAVYYLLRAIFFVAVGPDSEVFRAAFGPAVTTVVTMLLLVFVTFSMSELSYDQQTNELRELATRDGLTGALNRGAFLQAAQRQVALAVGDGASVIVADLDHFKELNDTYGHPTGDHALCIFTDVCRDVMGKGGIIGRLGGDEFVLLVDGQAESVVAEIARRYAMRATDVTPVPTVSFGIVAATACQEVSALVTRADVALYQAKAAGRGCAVRYDGHPPVRASSPAALGQGSL